MLALPSSQKDLSVCQTIYNTASPSYEARSVKLKQLGEGILSKNVLKNAREYGKKIFASTLQHTIESNVTTSFSLNVEEEFITKHTKTFEKLYNSSFCQQLSLGEVWLFQFLKLLDVFDDGTYSKKTMKMSLSKYQAESEVKILELKNNFRNCSLEEQNSKAQALIQEINQNGPQPLLASKVIVWGVIEVCELNNQQTFINNLSIFKATIHNLRNYVETMQEEKLRSHAPSSLKRKYDSKHVDPTYLTLLELLDFMEHILKVSESERPASEVREILASCPVNEYAPNVDEIRSDFQIFLEQIKSIIPTLRLQSDKFNWTLFCDTLIRCLEPEYKGNKEKFEAGEVCIRKIDDFKDKFDVNSSDEYFAKVISMVVLIKSKWFFKFSFPEFSTALKSIETAKTAFRSYGVALSDVEICSNGFSDQDLETLKKYKVDTFYNKLKDIFENSDVTSQFQSLDRGDMIEGLLCLQHPLVFDGEFNIEEFLKNLVPYVTETKKLVEVLKEIKTGLETTLNDCEVSLTQETLEETLQDINDIEALFINLLISNKKFLQHFMCGLDLEKVRYYHTDLNPNETLNSSDLHVLVYNFQVIRKRILAELKNLQSKAQEPSQVLPFEEKLMQPVSDASPLQVKISDENVDDLPTVKVNKGKKPLKSEDEFFNKNPRISEKENLKPTEDMESVSVKRLKDFITSCRSKLRGTALIKEICRLGFEERDGRGSHCILTNFITGKTVTVPRHAAIKLGTSKSIENQFEQAITGSSSQASGSTSSIEPSRVKHNGKSKK